MEHNHHACASNSRASCSSWSGSEQAVPGYFDFRLLLGFDMIGRVAQGPLFSNFGGQFSLLRND